MTNKEIRSLGRELRITQSEKGKTLQGYAAVFGVYSEDMGGWREKIDPSAFTRTLKANPDVMALYSHDVSLILGRTMSGTLELSVDDVGLRFSCLLPNTTDLRTIWSSPSSAVTSEATASDSLPRESTGMKIRMASWSGPYSMWT